MRLIMFGTGPFAVPTFESLLDSEHDVVWLVTRPIADSGKRRKSAENPTRDVAQQRGVEILDPVNVNDPEFVARLIDCHADLLIVCDYGQILSRECLAASRLGGINLHGSLLPKYRGAAPINWAIYHGDAVTGVTTIHMTAKLDGGPCLIKSETEIRPTETAEEIEPRLALLGVEPVLKSIAMLESWDGETPIGEKQDRQRATKAPRLQKSDGRIDWTRSATQIVNQIRAFQPWPGSFTSWDSTKLKQPLRLIVHRATAQEDDSNQWRPGQVAIADKHQLVIQAGEGRVSIEQIQPAGKRAMPIEDFLERAPASARR